ncbi:transposase [Alkalihalophilus pseudofirmus]|uniref:Transposase n=1 Tax=Alkalihalophilus pseudofirmus TaxID=79885 RepID=A0AAJ2U398_ALKPS|nr:transposase [Alkalihalophilus pseudofirmus]MDV2886362.1 transposase [Alkalihalophilus pseudofirmus]
MARAKRIWIPSRFYHIVTRGNRRDPLFRCYTDFQAFYHILDQLYEKIPFELASYCLMTNHYHLQLRCKEQSISKVMSLINKRYANYYNTRYRLTGHVFEKRYYDKIIETKEGMLEVSRYIHLNPIRAQMISRPEHYPWSSYHFYKYNKAAPVYLDTNSLLKYYAGAAGEQKRLYCESVEEAFLF